MKIIPEFFLYRSFESYRTNHEMNLEKYRTSTVMNGLRRVIHYLIDEK